MLYFSAYGAFVSFFSEEITTLGATEALEKYVFNEEANTDGKHMLVRVLSGV